MAPPLKGTPKYAKYLRQQATRKRAQRAKATLQKAKQAKQVARARVETAVEKVA